MKEISFKELVTEIDEKWGHTYEPVKLNAEYEEYLETMED
jgi:hypothetical protein